MKRQMATLLGALSFNNSNVPSNIVSSLKLFHYYVYNYILHFKNIINFFFIASEIFRE